MSEALALDPQSKKAVSTELCYTLDNGRPVEYYFYEPDPQEPQNPSGTDPRRMEIHDAWPLAERLSVDREGFELKPFSSAFDSWDSDAAIEADFYQEVVDFVIEHSGAKQVAVFDHTIRKRMSTELKDQTVIQRPAVLLVHSDYTPKSGPQRVRDVMGAEAEDLLKGRVAFFNVWKPLYETVEELPLALCDATSAEEADMIKMNLRYRERTGEIFVMRHRPQHRWYYFPKMRPDQAVLLKTYDSETDGRARFVGHTAFEDPNTPPDAPKRQSIELRTMAFF